MLSRLMDDTVYVNHRPNLILGGKPQNGLFTYN
nr:MAG TPA: hypothetical protein [Caudoviricetes sp.]